MDKITILLQDITTISELAKDPEVQIKIKDAIIDGVKRRSLKSMQIIEDKLHRELYDELFDKTWQRGLKQQYKKDLQKVAEDTVKNVIREDSDWWADFIRQEIDDFKESVKLKIASIDLDEIIRKEVRSIIDAKLSRRII